MSSEAKKIFQNIVNDIAVELSQEFDRNFERKAFFDKKWAQTKHPNHKGSILLRSGRLRKSIKYRKGKQQITWQSSMPYASIHNEGGIIVITAKAKRFFWAMYYQNANAVVYSVKKKAPAKTQRNKRLMGEAQKWKAMALLPVGTKIKIEQRQFIGTHPVVKQKINEIVDDNLKNVAIYMKQVFKKK